jgi:TonB family protein
MDDVHRAKNECVLAPMQNGTEKSMRLVKCALMSLALTTTGVWAQQAAPPAQSTQTETKTVSATPSQPPQTSSTDRIPACPAKWEFHPDVDGVYKVGGDVKPPKPMHSVEATFSDEARQMIRKLHLKTFEAVSLVGFTVSTEGKPQDLCLMKAASYGLDEQAIQAVHQFRFKPATKDGMPVAVRISLEMNFRWY